MGFDRDDFDNEINAGRDENTRQEGKYRFESNNEQRDIDSIIQKHSDSLARAAENIARNGSSAENMSQSFSQEYEKDMNVSSFDSNASMYFNNINNASTSSEEMNVNEYNREMDRENNRGNQPEDVQTETFATQPQKSRLRVRSERSKN